jgi:hypothetical protein
MEEQKTICIVVDEPGAEINAILYSYSGTEGEINAYLQGFEDAIYGFFDFEVFDDPHAALARAKAVSGEGARAGK